MHINSNRGIIGYIEGSRVEAGLLLNWDTYFFKVDLEKLNLFSCYICYGGSG